MTVTINKKTYEAGELVAYVEKLEKENAELKADYGVLSCSVGDFDKLQDKLEEEQRRNNGLSDSLTKAKEIIEELSKSLFLAKGIVRDLIDDTVDFKESKERAIYCYKQEKFDTYKEAVQFLKELSE